MRPAPDPRAPEPGSQRRAERRRRNRRGRFAEFAAAAVLLAKGYRILAHRWKSPLGEIDLIAARGRRLIFVEVKQRRSEEDAEAAISDMQSQRIRAAADLWLARNPRYQDHDIGFDAIFLVPRRWPQHVADGL